MVIGSFLADCRFMDACQVPDDLAHAVYADIDWSFPGTSAVMVVTPEDCDRAAEPDMVIRIP
jgi:hypothetical protein